MSAVVFEGPMNPVRCLSSNKSNTWPVSHVKTIMYTGLTVQGHDSITSSLTGFSVILFVSSLYCLYLI